MERALAIVFLVFSLGSGRCLLGPYGLNCHHDHANTNQAVMAPAEFWDSMLWDSGEWN